MKINRWVVDVDICSGCYNGVVDRANEMIQDRDANLEIMDECWNRAKKELKEEYDKVR